MAVRPRLEQKLDAPLDPILRLSGPSKWTVMVLGLRLVQGSVVGNSKYHKPSQKSKTQVFERASMRLGNIRSHGFSV